MQNLLKDGLPATGYIRQSHLIPSILPFSSATLWRKVKAGFFRVQSNFRSESQLGKLKISGHGCNPALRRGRMHPLAVALTPMLMSRLIPTHPIKKEAHNRCSGAGAHSHFRGH